MNEGNSGQPREFPLPPCLPHHYKCFLQILTVKFQGGEGGGVGHGLVDTSLCQALCYILEVCGLLW